MLNFDDEIIAFKLKGVEYSLTKPTTGQAREYTKLLDSALDDESKERALITFLGWLGLKEEIYFSLTASQLKILLSSLYDAEKN